MNEEEFKPNYQGFKPDIKIGGPGVVSVKANEVIKSDQGQRQIAALDRLVRRGVFKSRHQLLPCVWQQITAIRHGGTPGTGRAGFPGNGRLTGDPPA